MFSTIKRWFSGLLRKFWGLLKQIFDGAVEIALAQIQDIALYTVKELENTDMTNEEKRNEAFKRIKAYTMSKEINIQSSLINLAIEIAVQALKKNLIK